MICTIDLTYFLGHDALDLYNSHDDILTSIMSEFSLFYDYRTGPTSNGRDMVKNFKSQNRVKLLSQWYDVDNYHQHHDGLTGHEYVKWVLFNNMGNLFDDLLWKGRETEHFHLVHFIYNLSNQPFNTV